VLTLTRFDAKTDGTDTTEAIIRALTRAREMEQPLRIPAGVYGTSDLLNLDGVQLFAEEGAVFHSLNLARAGIVMKGDGPSIKGLRFTGVKPTGRLTSNASCRIIVEGATDFAIEGVGIESGAGAGIMVCKSANFGRITGSRFSGTYADSIHMTEVCSAITVKNNTIDKSKQPADVGDDAIAVVSYRRQGGVVRDILATHNTIIGNNAGRCMAVIGGENILYEDNEMRDHSGASGIHFAQEEGTYQTFGCSNVTARHNTVINCGSRLKGHGGITVVSAGGPVGGLIVNTGITLERNLVVQHDPTLLSIRILSEHNREVLLDQNVTASVTPMQIVSQGVVVRPYVGGPVGVRA
jgi:hypothetical protein